MSAPTVHLVPHTHWDREWYEPFQRFRLRLVDLLDEVLDWAEEDPRFRFTLDGQMAAVDDYLEVRPEHRDRVAALVRGGQLAVGPWQILLDEFLCSGESIVRNLELGWARAEALGGAMRVGYLPDEFGHCAQMPQILAGAGLQHACLWRGVPASVEGSPAFRWTAPDGSSVRCEYLLGGYGNAASLFADPQRFAQRAAALGAGLQAAFGDRPVLGMYGTDHSAPVRSLVGLVESLADSGAPVRMQITTLADYVQATDADQPDLPVVTGELRSHARANILPGVLSVRPHLKQAMARAERMVERYAEPLAALWSPTWPARFLDMAWWRLVDASGHDSVTGCGVDETAVQVAARIAEAEQLGQAVRDRVVAGLARDVPRDAVLVVNPTAADRTDLVELDLEVPADWPGVALELPDGRRAPAHAAGRTPHLLHEERIDAAALDTFFPRVHGRELFGLEVVTWAVDPQARVLEFALARHGGEEPFDVDDVRAAVATATARAPGPWTVRLYARERRTVTALVPVPALGWSSVRPVAADSGGAGIAHAVRADGRALDNGLVQVTVHDDGTLRIASVGDGTTAAAVLEGVGRIVDGGDRGDTYNYAPPGTDTVVDRPQEVRIGAPEGGPLRTALTVTRAYAWPAAMDWKRDRRRDAVEPAVVAMRVELRAGEPFVRLDVEIDNRSADHRVRLHVPLARPATTSHAEGQFAVVERGRTAEGGSIGEHPLPTFPAHGFVDAGGAGLLLTQAHEYELVDGDQGRDQGQELALTVLRCTGQISRNVHPYREEPAGPQIPTPQAQMIGTTTVSLAVLPHAGGWDRADLTGAGERYRHPLHAVAGQAAPGGPLADRAGLAVTGAVLTSVRRREGALEVRVVAESAEPATAVLRGPFRTARRVDLLGRPGEELATRPGPAGTGHLALPLRPWEIATVRLDA